MVLLAPDQFGLGELRVDGGSCRILSRYREWETSNWRRLCSRGRTVYQVGLVGNMSCIRQRCLPLTGRTKYLTNEQF